MLWANEIAYLYLLFDVFREPRNINRERDQKLSVIVA